MSAGAAGLAAGCALAAVLLRGYRIALAVAVGVFLAGATSSSPAAVSVPVAAITALEAVIAVGLLRRIGFRSLERTRDVIALVCVAVVVSTALGAVAAVGTFLLDGALTVSNALHAWRDWSLGHASAAMLMAPALFVLASDPATGNRSRTSREQRGVALVSLAALAAAVWLTYRGYGLLAGGPPDVALVRAQLLISLGAVAALLVVAARSERRSAEEALSRLLERERALAFRSLFESAPDPRLILEPTGRIALANSGAERLFGQPRSELVGLHVEAVLDASDGSADAWYHRRTDADPSELELQGRRKDGLEFPAELTVSSLDSEKGMLVSAVVRDVTQRKLAAEALAHQAMHDALTGLPNRMLFLDRLDQALVRARRSQAKLAVIFLDLDDFKLVNDTRGHDTGDLLLAALAPRLSGALRPGDTIARFGGDEFVVLCEGLSSDDDAEHIAWRISDACRQPVRVGDYEHTITVSAGVMIVEAGAGTASSVLRDADAAMYRAKASGKGRVEVFDERMRAQLIAELAVESELRQALRNDQLRVLYQPVMALDDGEIVGAEALLRWQHPVRGLLDAAEFIDVAESSGLIIPIGEWMIEQACGQAAAWESARSGCEPTYVSVNVSPRQVTRSGIAAAVRRILDSTGLEPGLLELEITERCLIEDPDASAQALGELKDMGVRLALDDFGTGYSALGHLKRFMIDKVKIDRSFVNELTRDEGDTAVVDAVLGAARALDVTVTAEGVESAEQLQVLRAKGCDFAQGSALAQPSSPEALSEMLESRQVWEPIAV